MADYTFAITGSDLSGPAWKAFVENVKKANDQVAQLGKTHELDKLAARTTSAQERIESLVKKGLAGMGELGERVGDVAEKILKVGSAVGTIARFGAIAGVLALAGKSAFDYLEGVQAAAAGLADLAGKTGLTIPQVQALQDLARRSGKTFEDLAAQYKDNKLGLDTLTATFVATGAAMDTNVTAKAAEMARKAKESEDRIAALKGKMDAFVAGLYVPAKATVLEEAAGYMERLASAINAADITKLSTLLKLIANPIGSIAGTVAGAVVDPVAQAKAELAGLGSEIADVRKQLDALDASPAGGKRQGAMVRQADRLPLADRLAQLEAQSLAAQAKVDAEIRKTWGGQGYGGADPFATIDPVIPKPAGTGGTTGGGSGGGGGRDRIGENLVQFTAQAEAARIALLSLQKVGQNPLIPLDDLERQVKLEKDIADAIAAAKKYAADDPRIPQLEQQIRRREEAESGLAKLTNAYKLADTTERQYGDGVAARMQTEAQLRDALDTRRLSTQAYDIAIQELGKSTEDLRLKNIGLAGGLPALAAGWEAARLQADRANNMFATGGKLYEQVVGTMTLATTSWGQTFDQVLLRAGESWARFLLDMAARAAASQVFSAIGGAGGAGGLLAAIFGSGTTGGSQVFSEGAGAAAQAAVGGGLFSAAGGPISAGQPSIVGESGVELFLPNTGGNILNRQQLDALGVGGGDGGSVVYQTINVSVGEFVTTQQWARDVPRITEAARTGASQALIAQRRRGVRAVKAAFA